VTVDAGDTPREITDKEKKKQKKKKQFTIHFQNVRITEKLAATGGSSAGVFSCYVDGWLCAVKEFEIDSRDSLVREQMGNFLQEIQVLEKLPPHNNIARYLYHEQTPTKIRLYLTKYATSLGERIRLRRENVENGVGEYYSPQDLLVFSLDIVRGIEFLHKHKIIHRDLV
jgi:serine/threonine protein kinase